MDKNRVAGSAKQITGRIKEAVGKATGDAKLEASGKADKTVGKIQNAVGGVKDALRGKRVALRLFGSKLTFASQGSQT